MWVAPNSIAFSRLNSIGSTAITCLRPGHRRALHGVDADAADADDDDGVARLRRRPGSVAEPHPVATPHDTSATASSGRSVVDLDHLVDSATQVCCANVPSLANSVELACRRPRRWRLRAVGDHPLEEGAGARSRTGSGGRSSSSGSVPHDGTNDAETWSPTATLRDAGPDLGDDAGALVAADRAATGRRCPAAATPPPAATMSPVTMCSSLWHSPAAFHSTITSPAFGGVDLDLLDLPVLVRPVKHRCLRLFIVFSLSTVHRVSSSRTVDSSVSCRRQS